MLVPCYMCSMTSQSGLNLPSQSGQIKQLHACNAVAIAQVDATPTCMHTALPYLWQGRVQAP